MPKPKSEPKATAGSYADKKRADNARSRRASEEAREIGPLPKVKNAPRRRKCADSLLGFCRTYFPAKFFLPFSPDHLTAIDRLERCVLGGGLFALAMPRGSGKSELSKRAVEWAILYGHRRFVVLVGATEGMAGQTMDDIKASFAANERLAEDFPEACHPVRKLEGIVHRAKGQLLGGKPTKLVWKQTEVRLAAVPKAACGGAVIRTVGLTGSIRGATATAADGGTMRPDLVVLDDPQTRESASSPTQTADRERIVRGDVLGLAGPTRTIAAVMPCTVIYPGDLADRFLDRDKAPQWNGVRCRLVASFPAAVGLWDRYFDLRANSLRAGGDGRGATEFYRQNRAAMDAGAVLGWPERYDAAKYLSAVEDAMVKRHDDPREFAAEYQNDPERDDGPAGLVRELVAADIAAKVNRVPRGTVPREATRLTAFVDVGAKVLWYAVVAWGERFDGAVVEYGTCPAQARHYFAAADARPALADVFPNLSEPQIVYAGLRAVADDVLGRAYPRQETGEPLRVERCLIDSGWLPDTVHQFCRQSAHAAVLYPSKGYAAGSSARPMDEWAVRPGERAGRGWRLSSPASGRGRLVTFDPDVWKSFVADRLLTPPGGGGCLTLYGDRAGDHQLFADHLTAEYAIRVTARGRTFDKWEQRPDRRDNHFLDCLAGAAVAVGVQGLEWSASGTPVRQTPRPKVRLSEIQARKRAAKKAGA